MVVASPVAQFDGKRFHDPEYVRSYRAVMLNWVRSRMQGFGIWFPGKASNLTINFVNNQQVLITYFVQEVHVSTTLSISLDGEVVQATRAKSRATTATQLDYVLALNVSVNRASYGQLTEGGPIPIPPSRNALQLFDNAHRWAVVNSNSDAMLEGGLLHNGQLVRLDSGLSETTALGKPINAEFSGRIQIVPGQSCAFISTFRLHPGTYPLRKPITPASTLQASRGQWRLENSELGLIIKRNLEYILSNCAIPVSNDATCFIADHVALPLGWNRDN
jgi:hypothetical protein